MSNQFYPYGLQAFAQGQINWLADTVVCALVDTTNYVYSPAHVTLADVPPVARVATSGTLSNRTAALGVLDADDVSFGTITGAVASALVLYKSTGVDLTSTLVAYMDQAQGLPVNPQGAVVTVVWDNGTNRIGAL